MEIVISIPFCKYRKKREEKYFHALKKLLRLLVVKVGMVKIYTYILPIVTKRALID